MEIRLLRRECTLCDAARDWGVNAAALAEINGLERSGLLPAGMSLVLPGEAGAQKGEMEIYYAPAGGILQGPGKLSFAALERDIDNSWAETAAFVDFAAERGALPVYTLRAEGALPQTRARLLDECGWLDELTERLCQAGFGALGLDFPGLLPFDRELFTHFAEKAARAAHEKGLWIICTLPLYTREQRHQRRCAAYDAAALGGIADRIIADSGRLMAADELDRGLSYMSGLVPGGRLLAGIWEGALLSRGEERERISARCALNIAAAARAGISRRAKGAPAEFSYRDPAGQLGRVACGDALWAREICTLAEKYSLAGLARRGAQGRRCGAERVLEGYFEPLEIL